MLFGYGKACNKCKLILSQVCKVSLSMQNMSYLY